jgi:membrane-associated protein
MELLKRREPSSIELPSGGLCAAPRDPVGLLDQRDVEAGGACRLRRGGQIGCSDPTARPVTEHQRRNRALEEPQMCPGGAVRGVEVEDGPSVSRGRNPPPRRVKEPLGGFMRQARVMGVIADRERVRRLRVICAAVLVLQGLYSLLLVPAVPSLIGRDPVLLEALRSSTAAMVAAGAFARVGKASFALALLAPLPTLMMADPFLWWAGRLWGPDIAKYLGGRSARAKRRTERAVRLLERYDSWAVVLAYLLPVPSAVIYAAAGWTGMRLRRFLVLDLLGTAIWIGLVVGLGYAIGSSAVQVAREITHYSLYTTLGLVAAALVVGVVRGLPERETQT